MPDTDENQKITETLYQHNLELSVKNKTLSLIGKLYQESVSVLMPEVMAQGITDIIRENLNLEFAGILHFKKKYDRLDPIAFSKSERLTDTLKSLGFLFIDIKIPDVSKNEFIKEIIYDKKWKKTDKFEDIWSSLIKTEFIKEIKEKSHIKTILLYPLLTDTDVFQILILGMNRDYETLDEFEKTSIENFRNIIVLSLNKAYLYKDLLEANENLKNLIKQRESLVHLITHKVKGSFTHSKYIFAEMVEGTFGPISPELKSMAKKGLDSDNLGIETVDLVLNAANLTKGTIKYDMKVLDFKEIVLKTIDYKKDLIGSKKIEIENKIKDTSTIYNVLGDVIWLREVVNNLIDNAIKYTEQGKISFNLENKDGKILFSIKDTGVGINDEDKKNLFTEGGRGKDSVKINVDSTGYGLYTVKLIVEAHKGRVWAESEGTNKGSEFFVELPCA